MPSSRGTSLQCQAQKSGLPSHYDERIEGSPATQPLDALADSGSVEHRTERIHDGYALPEDGDVGFASPTSD